MRAARGVSVFARNIFAPVPERTSPTGCSLAGSADSTLQKQANAKTCGTDDRFPVVSRAAVARTLVSAGSRLFSTHWPALTPSTADRFPLLGRAGVCRH